MSGSTPPTASSPANGGGAPPVRDALDEVARLRALIRGSRPDSGGQQAFASRTESGSLAPSRVVPYGGASPVPRDAWVELASAELAALRALIRVPGLYPGQQAFAPRAGLESLAPSRLAPFRARVAPFRVEVVESMVVTIAMVAGRVGNLFTKVVTLGFQTLQQVPLLTLQMAKKSKEARS